MIIVTLNDIISRTKLPDIKFHVARNQLRAAVVLRHMRTTSRMHPGAQISKLQREIEELRQDGKTEGAVNQYYASFYERVVLHIPATAPASARTTMHSDAALLLPSNRRPKLCMLRKHARVWGMVDKLITATHRRLLGVGRATFAERRRQAGF